MRRIAVLLALILVSLPLATALSETPVVAPKPLQLEKECVIIGRIVGTDVLLFPVKKAPAGEKPLPAMARIGGFEILNTGSKAWQPLTLSKEGYFCANVGMGEYEFRGRDSEGRPFLIHSFKVPKDMAVNLGTFFMETRDPAALGKEKPYKYDMADAWRIYREGANHVALRLEHVKSEEAYVECEEWFAGCHQEAYEQFEKVMARR